MKEHVFESDAVIETNVVESAAVTRYINPAFLEGIFDFSFDESFE